MRTALYYLLMALILVIVFTRCTRKATTQRSETTTQDASKHVIDSLTEVTHTLSEAYESLLQSQTGTEVTVKDEKPPAGMPHILSEVTVHPDGSKTIKGGTIIYRDNALTTQRISNLRSWIIDSMSSLHKLDTASHAVKTVEVIRTVKQTVFPWWFWLLLIPAALIGYIVRHKLNPLHI